MTILLLLLFLAAAAAAIGYPLWKQGSSEWAEPPHDSLEDLILRRQTLEADLRELAFDLESGRLPQADFERLRAIHERELAGVRAQEESVQRARPTAQPAPAHARAGRGATVRRPLGARLGLVLPALALVVVGVTIGFFLAQSLAPRQEGMGITGAPGGGGESAPVSPSGPAASGGIPGLLRSAGAALERGDLKSAIDQYRQVLDRDPQNVTALTQIGVILARAQHYDQAIATFDRVLAISPDDPRALYEKGLVYFQGKVQPREGVKIWEQLIATAPPDNPYAKTARDLLAQVRSSMGRPRKPPAASDKTP